MQQHKKVLSIPLVLVSLTACGGGGGGGDDGAASLYAAPKEEVVVSDSATADSTVTGVQEVLDSTEFSTSYKGNTARQPHGWVEIETVMQRVAPWDPSGTRLVAGAGETQPCDEGSVTVSSSGNGEAGSTASMTFNNCVFYLGDGGIRFTGAMDARVVATSGSFSSSASDWAFTYLYDVSHWKGEEVDINGVATGDYFLMHGGFQIQAGYVASTRVRTTSREGSAMYFDDVYLAERTETLFEDFNQTFTENLTTYEETYSNDMTLTSTRIGGKVVVDTVTPFKIPSSSYSYPQEGQLIVTASGDAKVRLTAIGNNQATIEYDVSPVDGTYENSVTKYWYEL